MNIDIMLMEIAVAIREVRDQMIRANESREECLKLMRDSHPNKEESPDGMREALDSFVRKCDCGELD